MNAVSPRLGRGLDALLGAPTVRTEPERQVAAIAEITPGPFQPRRHFDDAELDALADSIRRHGVVQPILVRPTPSTAGAESPEGGVRFQIVTGERRWRAAQRAGLSEIPVIIDTLADRDALEIAIIENVQREDLNPLEEAESYRRLIDEFGGTQDSLAKVVGKSRSHIANMMRLLGLSEPVREMVVSGVLSAGHGRALLGAQGGAEGQTALAKKVASGRFSVRQTENLVRKQSRADQAGAQRDAVLEKRRAKRGKKSGDVAQLERELGEVLGLAVSIVDEGQSGQVQIAYGSLEQLDMLIERLRELSMAAYAPRL